MCASIARSVTQCNPWLKGVSGTWWDVAGSDMTDRDAAKSGRSIDAGADGRAAQRQLVDPSQGRLDALHRGFDLTGVTAELLAERHGDGVLQVGAPHLDDILERAGFLAESLSQGVERWKELFVDQ